MFIFSRNYIFVLSYYSVNNNIIYLYFDIKGGSMCTIIYLLCLFYNKINCDSEKHSHNNCTNIDT